MRLIRGNNHEQWKVIVAEKMEAQKKYDKELEVANEALRIIKRGEI